MAGRRARSPGSLSTASSSSTMRDEFYSRNSRQQADLQMFFTGQFDKLPQIRSSRRPPPPCVSANEADENLENTRQLYDMRSQDSEDGYVRKYKEKERRRVKDINTEIRRAGVGEVVAQAAQFHASTVMSNWRDKDMSVDGTRCERGTETLDDFYRRHNFDNRRVDLKAFPISLVKDKILSEVNTHQVTIIEGFTGCGKTTQVPQFLLDDAKDKSIYCNIAVTQPRRIAARSVATRVCFERCWDVGSIVGYQIGMERHNSDDSRITYMTTGVLLQQLIHRKMLNNYTHIIIDEVHERDLETDLLMLVVKQIMVEKKDVRTRVILMSATINTDTFLNYFPQWNVPEQKPFPAVVHVPSAALFTVTEHYVDSFVGIELSKMALSQFSQEPSIMPETYEVAAAVIESFDIIERNERRYNRSEKKWAGDDAVDRGAVLVFLPGINEIDSMMNVLNDMQRTKAGHDDNIDLLKWTIIPLHSSCTVEEQKQVFMQAPRGRRKIILATNIAESSITVTDIKYVVDFCLTKTLCTDPATNYTCLKLEWASKNQCIQRRGRCGRVSPGSVYRMVPKSFYENLAQEADSEMKKSSLENVVLRVKKLSMGSPKALLALALDPPRLKGIRRAVANLKEVGALTVEMIKKGRKVVDDCDGDLTYIGEVISGLPIDVRLGRLIMLGHVFGLLDETIIIAAGLSSKSPFSQPFHRRIHAYMSKLYWSQNAFSDCFALVNLYRTWTRKYHHHDFRMNDDEVSWAKQYLVQHTVMREMYVAIEEIKERLKRANIDVENNESPMDLDEHRGLLLKVVIAGAFYPNYYIRDEPTNYDNYSRDIQRALCNRAPETTVYFRNFKNGQSVELYAETLLAPFQESSVAGGGSIPRVEADGEKVLLSFDERGHKVGNLCHGLYRAIRLRQLRETVTLNILTANADAAAELDRALGDLKIEERSLQAPAQLPLNDVREGSMDVLVTHVESPSEFYVIRTSDEPRLEKLSKAVISCQKSLRRIRPKEDNLDAGEGLLVLIDGGGVLLRARVEKVGRNQRRQFEKIAVFRIDVGGLIWVEAKELLVIERCTPGAEVLYETPGLAIQCRLRELRCLSFHDGQWTKSCVARMKKVVDRSYEFQIYSILGNVMTGDLVSRDEKKESIREHLINAKLAEVGPETFDSQRDHEWRLQGLASSYGRNEAKKTMPRIMDATLDGVTEEIQLKGPYSPIEMVFRSACRNPGTSNVSVEGASVNCVALEQYPWDPVTRVLVAGSVSVGGKSNNLILRDTTLLPPILGLPSLLTIIFAPKVEFRVSEDGRRYTGVVGGLGTDPAVNQAIYADHDVEMVFDVEITNEDIEKINCVRLGMNYVLRQDSRSKVSNLRETVIEHLLAVLHRPRTKMTPVHFEHEFKWDVYSRDLKLLKPKRVMNINHTDVFQFHDGFVLQDDSSIAPVYQSRSMGFNRD